MKNLHRGEVYYINFPYTFDKKYQNGKSKFVLVLQEGDYFNQYDTVEVLLITSDKEEKNHNKYITNIEIPLGTTKLDKQSWICCSQPYPVEKKLFNEAWRVCKLSNIKMNEVDEALYIGLCFGIQNEKREEIDSRYIVMGHAINN